MWDPDLFHETLHFAAAAHEGQFVPGQNYSYVVHLIGVCMEALRAASIEPADSNLIMQCALLHDTMEDTPITLHILSDRFGQEVAEGVLALTHQEEEPISEHLKKIAMQKKEIWMVKLADRIWNMNAPPDHWEQDKRKAYREEAKVILETLKRGSPYLAARLSDKIYAYGRFINV
ncbi:MAG: HD domain-containing protein [Spirochaetia bacterium]|jgi:(p)ppGpp synthase/HD superfamily hydrolase|nr:HD domain-containing protein [Spirochaetia bacterium]